MTDDENQERYEAMRSDLATGECAVLDDSRSGPTVVRFCRQTLGVIDDEAYREKRRPFRRHLCLHPAGAARNQDGDGPPPVLASHLPRQ